MSALNNNNEELEQDTWGRNDHLTKEQAEALAKFTSVAKEGDLNLAKYHGESLENVCLRFLRARQFRWSPALELLKKCVKKKTAGQAMHVATMEPSDVLNCDIDVFKKFYPHTHLGYDKLNRPILYGQYGKVSPAAVASLTTPEALVKYHLRTIERDLNDMFEQAVAEGKPVTFSTCAIVDLEGLGMEHCTGPAFEQMESTVALDNVCYPETLGKMFAVNAPWLAVKTWDIVKGWFDSRTQSKIEILGSGPEMNEKLLTYINADVLPVKYGGTAPDWTSARPLAEYLSLNRTSDARREVTVPPGHTLYVETFVPAGEVFVEVYVPDNHTSSTAPPPTAATSEKTLVKLSTLTQLSKVKLHGHSGAPPARQKQHFVNPTQDNMYFVLRWAGTALLKSRSVVANVYVEEGGTGQ
eukprot:gene9300-10960_t